jgi:hypothetical protein
MAKDRKRFESLLPEDAREDFAAWVDSELESAREAGQNAAGYDRRTLERAAAKAQRERDNLAADLEAARTAAGSAGEAVGKVEALEAQLAAVAAERDSLRPVVERYRGGVLRDKIAATARLRDPLLADALVSRLGLALGDGDDLHPDSVKAVTEWAADPANASRVVPEKPQAPGLHAPPLSGNSGGGFVPASASRWMQNLPPKEREIVEAAQKQ